MCPEATNAVTEEQASLGPISVPVVPHTPLPSQEAHDLSVPRPKINVLLLSAGLNIGGLEVVIQRLAETIDRTRFNVTVCCIKTLGVIGEQLISAGIDTVTLSDDAATTDYFTFLKLLKLIRAKGIQVVHAHTTDALADAAVCKVLLPRLRLIHTFHFGNYPYRPPRHLWMERAFSRLADVRIAVGEVQRRQIMSAFWLHENRIRKVWNGVSAAESAGSSDLRSTLGAEDRVVIGTICTLIEQKGLRDLLAVASAMRTVRHRVLFVIVGDGPLKQELEAKRLELGIDDFLVFTGWVQDAAKRALPAFDIFFQPSLWEAMSMVVLEAMAAAKPIVATRVGETRYVIQDGEEGILVPPTDISSMTGALLRLVHDPELRRRLGDAAERKFQKSFTVAHMTREYERIYGEVLSKR